MDRGAWQAIVHRIVTSRTQLKRLHIHAYKYIYPSSHTWSSCPYCLFHCCYSVTKSCPTLCNPTDHSTPDFPVLHYLPVCSNSCSLNQWCHPTISFFVAPFYSCLQSFPASGSFPMSQLFASGSQRLELQLQHQSFQWIFRKYKFPLGLTGLISLQSQGLSSVFSSTTVWKHQFFSIQPSLWSNSHIHTEKWKWSHSVVSNSLWPHGLYPPGFSVHGILQARVPEWVAFSFFIVQLSHPHMATGKSTALTVWTFVGKVMSLFWPHFSKTVLCHHKFFTPLTEPSLAAVSTDSAF